MLMITDLMLDTVLHLPPLHQHMVPQLLAMTLQLPHMSSQLTPMESFMEVMKKRLGLFTFDFLAPYRKQNNLT